MQIEIPVSFGELVDKITILEIKCARIADPDRQALAQAELELLQGILAGIAPPDGYDAMKAELSRVNEVLWDIEDRIRAMDADGNFGNDFVNCAQSVYRQNDLRFRIKTRLSHAAGSQVEEVKSYLGR